MKKQLRILVLLLLVSAVIMACGLPSVKPINEDVDSQEENVNAEDIDSQEENVNANEETSSITNTETDSNKDSIEELMKISQSFP